MLLLTTAEVPGPIDNQQLIGTLHGTMSQKELVPGTDYVQVSSAMWQFLHAIYGGGPAIELPLDPVLPESSITSHY